MRLTTLKTSYASLSSSSEMFRSIYSIKGYIVQKEKSNFVRLYSSLTNQLIRTVSTDDLGNYSFNSLPQQSYFVIIRDKTKQYNAVIQDNILPK